MTESRGRHPEIQLKNERSRVMFIKAVTCMSVSTCDCRLSRSFASLFSQLRLLRNGFLGTARESRQKNRPWTDAV